MTYEEIVALARSMGCSDVWRDTKDGLPFKIKYNHCTFMLNRKNSSYLRIFRWDKDHRITYKDSVILVNNNDVKIKPKDLENIIKHTIKILKEIDEQNKLEQMKEDFV